MAIFTLVDFKLNEHRHQIKTSPAQSSSAIGVVIWWFQGGFVGYCKAVGRTATVQDASCASSVGDLIMMRRQLLN